MINKDLTQVKDYNENKDHIQEESIGLTESDLSEILDKESSSSWSFMNPNTQTVQNQTFQNPEEPKPCM